MAVSTTATLTTQQRTMYVGTLLKRLIPYLPLLEDAQRVSIPNGQGKTVDFRRYTALALATTALTEGTTPSGSDLAQTNVTATIAQYGDFITLSDMLIATGIDNNVVAASEVLGEQAGQTVHRLMVNQLGSASTVRYAAGRASRVTVAAGDNLTVTEIRKAVRDLEKANVPKFPDGTYHGAISASQKYDLIGSNDFKELSIYTNSRDLRRNEVGDVYGARLFVTTDVPIFTGAGAAGIDVHAALIYGPNAFGAVDLAAMGRASINSDTNRGVQVFITPLDTPDKSDPLRQRAYVAWKIAFVAKVLDATRIIRIETAVTA